MIHFQSFDGVMIDTFGMLPLENSVRPVVRASAKKAGNRPQNLFYNTVNIFVDDTQPVTDVQAVLFSTIQQGGVNALVTLQNPGANPIVYDFQEFDGTSWDDMGVQWATGEAYTPGQQVVHASGSPAVSNAYVCLIAHTSGNFDADLLAGDWLLLGAAPPYQGTLAAGQTVSFPLQTSNPAYTQAQLLGYATGGSVLVFSLSRFFSRTSGGAVPLLT